MSKKYINNQEVSIPVTVEGEGQQIIFFNGGGATQISWKNVIKNLKGAHQLVTFDFRGHGKASISDNYSFNGFLSDAEAVVNEVCKDKAIIVGWSLGADLALEYATAHSDKVAGLVLIDGAVPLSEPLVKDEAQLRQSLKSPVMKLSRLLIRFTPYKYQIWGDAYADIVMELDKRRQNILNDYKKLACPTIMILAEESAGSSGARAERNNKIWHDGATRLLHENPSISVQWIEGSHQLPFKHPVELAEIIDTFALNLQ